MTEPETVARPVVVLAPDLMDRSRIAAAVPDVVFARDAAELRTLAARVLFVDVGRPGALDAVAARRSEDADLPIIGFGSHVDDELLTAARAAGCTEVLPRSRFFRNVTDLQR
jgi:hypothetical protein